MQHQSEGLHGIVPHKNEFVVTSYYVKCRILATSPGAFHPWAKMPIFSISSVKKSRLISACIVCIIKAGGGAMRFKEVERLIKKDGWYLKNANGSHMHYVHREKPGKITIPNHPDDLDPQTVKAILKAAGLK